MELIGALVVVLILVVAVVEGSIATLVVDHHRLLQCFSFVYLNSQCQFLQVNYITSQIHIHSLCI